MPPVPQVESLRAQQKNSPQTVTNIPTSNMSKLEWHKQKHESQRKEWQMRKNTESRSRTQTLTPAAVEKQHEQGSKTLTPPPTPPPNKPLPLPPHQPSNDFRAPEQGVVRKTKLLHSSQHRTPTQPPNGPTKKFDVRPSKKYLDRNLSPQGPLPPVTLQSENFARIPESQNEASEQLYDQLGQPSKLQVRAVLRSTLDPEPGPDVKKPLRQPQKPDPLMKKAPEREIQRFLSEQLMSTGHVHFASQIYTSLPENPVDSSKRAQHHTSNTPKKRELNAVDRDELFLGVQNTSFERSTSQGSAIEHEDHAQSLSHLPASLVAGRKHQAHVHASSACESTSTCPQALSSNVGMSGIALDMGDFRGSLPANLQPKEPVHQNTEPAPRIPPIVFEGKASLYDDKDLANFLTSDKSNLEPFKGKMPVSTSIVKGDLGRLVGK